MTEPTQGERLARVEEALRGVQKTLDQLVVTLTNDRTNMVPRSEYEEYKKGVADKFKEIDSRRAPWWIVAGIAVSVLTAGIAMFNLLTKVG